MKYNDEHFYKMPFTFNGFRSSVLVYFIAEYALALKPYKEGLYISKQLQEIPDKLNEKGPFIVQGIYQHIRKKKVFITLQEAIVSAKEIDDGTLSFIRDKDDKTIAKIDAG